jgi:tRNA 2-thiouridine synthesizing protein A|tara:strand:- start:53 stop:304 length:252 start_codon:yes stop_codon:yes gene_type:complete
VSNPSPTQTLDARGLFCPEPVMMLHKVINEVPVGGVIEILATDPSTVRDFTKFCAFLVHELVVHEEVGGEFRFLIRKGEEEEE